MNGQIASAACRARPPTLNAASAGETSKTSHTNATARNTR